MNNEMISAYFHASAATFPRGVYCLVFQMGGDDNAPSLHSIETSGITLVECPMCEALIEEGLDIKKHCNKIIPRAEKLFKKAFLDAVAELAEKEVGEE